MAEPIVSTIISLLVAGFTTAVPVAVIVGLLAWSARVTKRRRAAFAAVAQSLGLRMLGDRVFGVLDGQPVELGIEWRGSGKSKKMYTVVQGRLVPPLDLGLYVSQRGFVDDVASFFGKRHAEVGDRDFDAEFVVSADEPARAARLLGPALRKIAKQVLASGESFHLTDGGFTLACAGGDDDERWLAWALRTAAHVARAMNEARRHVPPAARLAAARDAWAAYARTLGLTGMDTPLCMWGRLEGTIVTAYATRVREHEYETEVLAAYPEPLGLGLFVRPARTLDGLSALFGGEDHELGDERFDDAFVVKASRPEALADALGAEVRALLLELLERSSTVHVRDDGVTVRSSSKAHDPSEIPRLLDSAKAIADAVFRGVRTPRIATPYR